MHYQELERNSNVFKELLSGLSSEEYLWKPQQDKWCLLEIICHLYDEEREDFRARAKHVLETPNEPLPPTDPVEWAKSRNYIQQDYTETLNKFLDERIQSVKWLKSLTNPKWDNAYNHETHGKLYAKMFLTNWVAHDYLHIRQITKLKFEYLKHISGDGLSYAGDW